MDFNVVPLFKSHHSVAKSILTLEALRDFEEEEKVAKDKLRKAAVKAGELFDEDKPMESLVEPDSIIQICKDNGMKHVVLVEDSMGGFMQAYKNSEEAGLDLIFGLRLSFVNDLVEEGEDLVKSHHKNIVFAKNKKGYEALIRLSTLASTEFAEKNLARIDYEKAKELWTDDLILAIPFYDSFIHKNNLTFSSCIPTIDFTKPWVFLEDNGLPFDYLIRDRAKGYAEANGYDTQEAQTIYYKDDKDFKAWQTFKCMQKKFGRVRTLERPELEHCCSDTFSFETWKKKNES
jgi:DNA polymerase III alpha subunit